MSQKISKSLYFIALVPEEPLLEELWKLKKIISEEYYTRQALRSPPHVTLFMPFQWRDDREEKLIEHLSQIDHPEVKLELSGFDAFPPRVLYMDVVQHNSLMDLQQHVLKLVRRILPSKDGNYKDRGFTPHLTLAFRDLRKSEFQKAWEAYKDREFKAEQRIVDVCLLKHNGKYWEIFRKFPLRK